MSDGAEHGARAPAPADAPTLSAIVPVHDGWHYLERSLPALLAQLGEDLLEVLVVDDGSADGSGERAKALGARVERSDERRGPGAARNLGARTARGEALLFVDADVALHRDAAGRVREALRDRSVVAVFGSYDDRPPERNFMSQYTNLRHHFFHQAAPGEASTFWTGLGAVRRAEFLAVGGFDAGHYDRPSIEDIELGYRLRARGGRILLLPEIQGTHLKRWSLREAVRTDVFRRAIPWARLLLSRPEAGRELNAASAERAKAVVAALLAASTLLWAVGLLGAALPLLALALATGLSWRFVRLVGRRAGARFALGALLFHQLYYLYGSAAYGWCWLERRLGSRTGNNPRRSDAAGP